MENNVDTGYWYTDEDINAVLQVRVKDLGGFATDKTFLLPGIGPSNDYPEEGENKRYQILITHAVDSQNPLFFFDCTHQMAPDLGRPDDRRDIFGELAPLLTDRMANIKILFPYNSGGGHWLLCEIKLCKIDNEFTINYYLHDPYGAGQWYGDKYKQLCECFENKIRTFQPAANIRFNNQPSPYEKPRQSDGTSCGVIVVEDLLKRIAGSSLNMERPYPLGAKELREQNIQLLEYFYRQELNNSTLVNFKRRNFQRLLGSDKQSNQPILITADSNHVIQHFTQSPTLFLNSTLQNNAANSNLQTSAYPNHQAISQTNTQTFSSAVDQKLKARLLNRCNLIIAATEELIKQLEQTKLADKTNSNELLKKSLTKYFTKNILLKTNALQGGLVSSPGEEVSTDLRDQMRSILTYIERFNERRLKAGACKNHYNHYELLLHPARLFLTNTLNELAGLATLNPPRPEEIEMDSIINTQAEELQQQQKLATKDDNFQTALKSVCVWARQLQADVSVFISYAWSSELRPWEQWIHPFLQTLKTQLEQAGILVYMDIYDSRYGFNSYHHMDRIDNCHYVVLIGTESLLDKYQRGISAVCYELNQIRKRREQDAHDRIFTVIPIVVSGTLRTALPGEYERFTVIESFLGGSYVQTIKELLAKLYNVSPEYPDFAKAWEPCTQLVLQQTQASIATIKIEKQEEKTFHQYSSSVAPKNGTSFSNYIDKLKVVYQDSAFSGVQRLFDDEIMSIEDYYVNLILIKEEEQKRKEEEYRNEDKLGKSLEIREAIFEQNEMMELFTSAEQFFTVQEPIELKNIFNCTDYDKSKVQNLNNNRILILGRAGIGKSTLCQFIVNQWAQDKLWNDKYQGIFRIPLRNLVSTRYTARREYTQAEIINRECFANRLTEIEQKQLENDLYNNSNRYLIILDGYDELSNQSEDQHLINQVDMFKKYPEVIVTSRPQSIDGFAAKRKLEILGFTQDNIKQYIKSFFVKESAKGDMLLKYMQKYSLFNSLGHIPLNLELICSAWGHQHFQADITFTALYQSLLQWLEYRYLKKFHTAYNQPSQQQKLNDLTTTQRESLCLNWIIELEKIAWKMRQEGKIYINKDKIFAHESNLEKRAQLFKELRESGLLRLTSDKLYYYFVHLTFQEFFAARYYARIIKNIETHGDAEYEKFLEYFKENKFNPKLQIVWWFVSGLIKKDHKALEIFFALLVAEPRDILGVNELPLFMHCLEQSDILKQSHKRGHLFYRLTNALFYIFIQKMRKITSNNFNLIQSFKICPNLLSQIAEECAKTMQENKTDHREVFDLLTKFADQSAITKVANVLIQTLESPDKWRRFEAAYILGQVVNKEIYNEIMEALLKKLKNSNEVIREIAVFALGRLSEKTTDNQVIKKALLNAIKDESLGVKNAAAFALGQLGEKADDEIVEALLQMLSDSDESVKETVIFAFGQLGKKAVTNDVIKVLLNVLNNSNKRIKATAIYTLGKFGEQGAVPNVIAAILHALKDTIESVRYEAAFALGHLGENASNREVIRALLEALNDTNGLIREQAAYALEQLGQTIKCKKVIKTLLCALDDENILMRKIIISTLENLGYKAATKEVFEVLLNKLNTESIWIKNVVKRALKLLASKVISKDIISMLLSALQSPIEEIREIVILVLAQVRKMSATPELIELLLKVLIDPNGIISNAANYVIRKLIERTGDQRIVKALIISLKDPNENLRGSICSVLGQLKENMATKKVFNALLERIKDKNGWVSNQAAFALKNLGKNVANQNVIKTLLSALKSSNELVRNAAVGTLEQISDKMAIPRVIELLLNAANEPDALVKSTAIYAIGRLGENGLQEKVVNTLIKALTDPVEKVKIQAVLALGQLGAKVLTKDVIKILINMLKDENNQVRYQAYFSLGRFGKVLANEEVIEAVVVTLKDSNMKIRYQAIYALARLGKKAATKEVMEAILVTLKDSNIGIRYQAIYALSQFGKRFISQEIIEALLYALKDSIDDIRRIAVFALGQFGKKLHNKEKYEALLHTISASNYNLEKSVNLPQEPLVEKKLIEQVTEELLLAQKDSSVRVREMVPFALRQLVENAACKEMINILFIGIKDSNEQIKERAFYLLEQLAKKLLGKEDIEIFLDALKEPNIQLRKAASEILKQLGTKGATKEILIGLINLIGDKDTVSDTKQAAVDIIIYIFFKNLAVLSIYSRKLYWFDPKHGKVTVQLPDLLYKICQREILKAVEKNYEISMPLIPRSFSDLHIFINEIFKTDNADNLEHNYAELIKNAITKSDYIKLEDLVKLEAQVLNLVDPQAGSFINFAFNKTESTSLNVQKLLLCHRPHFPLIILESILHNKFSPYYSGERSFRAVDLKVIEKIITCLVANESLIAKSQLERHQLIAYSLDMELDKNMHPARGLNVDDYLLFRLSHYLRLWIKLDRDEIAAKDYPYSNEYKKITRYELLAFVKNEMLLICEAWRTYEEIQAILFSSWDDYEKEGLWESLAEGFIKKIKALKEREQIIFPTGYNGHCIYAIFLKQDSQIVGRIDNLLVDDLKKYHLVQGLHYKPYLAGIWDNNEQQIKSLRNYFIKLGKSFGLNRREALPLIYQKQSQNHDVINAWPFFKEQQQDNCVVKSYSVGARMRAGSEDIFNFLEEDHAKAWVEISQKFLQNLNDNHNGNEITSEMTNIRLCGLTKDNKTIEEMYSTPLMHNKHEKLMQKLSQEMNVAYKEVLMGNVVEQALINMASISIIQKEVEYRPHDDFTTYFVLQLNDDDTLKIFIKYYKEKFPEFIKDEDIEKIPNGLYKVYVNTDVLYEKVSTALREFCQYNNNTITMDTLNTSLANYTPRFFSSVNNEADNQNNQASNINNNTNSDIDIDKVPTNQSQSKLRFCLTM